MYKVPWAEPLEKKLRPYQGLVTLSLVAVILITLYVLAKGTAIMRTAWLVWCISP